jgi:hypothetical protein
MARENSLASKADMPLMKFMSFSLVMKETCDVIGG